MKEYRKKGKKLVYSKTSTKTQKPSEKGYVECRYCDKRIYSFDTSKLYYHILFEHFPMTWVESRDVNETWVKCKVCGGKIPYFDVEDSVKFIFRMEEHIFREHKLIDFFTNHLVDETTVVIEFICPNTKCKRRHKSGLGYAWCTEYHYKNNDVKLMCPTCLSFLIPKEEWERLK